ncbi:non-homologous end-joining DNA ligase [Paenibacillus xerothermodurans]|uniref:DNA polymerase domain-containing protein n=1 Tax=Paenibacillus xerothermodurans TaxID=1977292 RepID=A0A2W1P257_PAEXE|nr:non-homologous end-joining DNA ligase [Paenibacillus xerothermodurans]PZE21228.1 DNA polymerase domain-containing protein [Paenibacillus xerothermodurans]
MKEFTAKVEGKEVAITHPDRVIWPELGITKWDYIGYLTTVAPYLLEHAKDRMLMIWRYPEGIGGRRIEERSVHGAPPDWVPRVMYNDKQRILLNDTATLVWLANWGAVELHVPFDTYYRKDYPTDLVLDLDPPDEHSFDLAAEVALRAKAVLDSLSLTSVPRTSGATGMQIYVPIEPAYRFEEARAVNRFLAEYLQQQLPAKVTLERVVRRRGNKLYVDYLQLWRGRTMPAPYAVRARQAATVATPVSWEEVERGIQPGDFTILTVPERVERLGDLFRAVTTEKHKYANRLDHIIQFVKGRT